MNDKSYTKANWRAFKDEFIVEFKQWRSMFVKAFLAFLVGGVFSKATQGEDAAIEHLWSLANAAVVATSFVVFHGLWAWATAPRRVYAAQQAKIDSLQSELDEAQGVQDSLEILFEPENVQTTDDASIFRVHVHNKSNETIPVVRAYCSRIQYVKGRSKTEAANRLTCFTGDVPLSVKSGYGMEIPPKEFRLLPDEKELVDVIKQDYHNGFFFLCHEIGEWQSVHDCKRPIKSPRNGKVRKFDDALPFGSYEVEIVAKADGCRPVRQTFRINSSRRDRPIKIEFIDEFTIL